MHVSDATCLMHVSDALMCPMQLRLWGRVWEWQLGWWRHTLNLEPYPPQPYSRLALP